MAAPMICHVHELEIAIRQFCGLNTFRQAIPHIRHFIAVAEAVKKNLVQAHCINEGQVTVVYECVPVHDYQTDFFEEATRQIRQQLSVDEASFVVCASGTTDWRKGVDLFAQIANRCQQMTNASLRFIWVGGASSGLEYDKLVYDVERLGLTGIVHFVGVVENPVAYFALADVFILPSREDPFPLVCLEAASLGKPILCFDQAGGMPEFVQGCGGVMVPYLNIDAFATEIVHLQTDANALHQLGKKTAEQARGFDVSRVGSQVDALIHSLVIA
ncbi:MAG: glycosyltransferase family 4 protein [Ferruginibacter sp.]|nr:glycosyltransferase family 4 protein [Cytophagales bacterium]